MTNDEMANTEQIEAKLCAYIDGELDAAGRSEIEQHLAANPQHRQLLEELREQRQFLRDLPREKAPEDLFESFQAQLERSVLLDGGRPQVAGRINPWPQVIALAAVLMLAVGLASVIYFVLPDQSKQRTNYAVLPSAAAPVSAPIDSVQPSASPAPATTMPAVVTLGPERRMVAEKTDSNGGALAMRSEAAQAPSPAAPGTTLALAGKQAGDIFAQNSIAQSKGENKADNKLGQTMFEQLPLEPEIQRSVTSAGFPDN